MRIRRVLPTFLAAFALALAPAAAVAAVAPAPFDFGGVGVGTAATQVFTVSNDGTADLRLLGIALSGADFALDLGGGPSPCGSVFPRTIPPAGTCTAAVTFSPASSGPHSATLTVDSDDPVTPATVVSIGGTALPGGHILDGTTLALWRLDEPAASSNALDDTGRYHLQQFGGPDAIPGEVGNARRLVTPSKFFQRQGDAALGTALNGDWTYEGWVFLDPAIAGWNNLFIYNGLAFSFNPPDTILAEVGVSPDRKVYWHQWQSTGAYTETRSNATLQPGRYYHVAVSRSAQGGNLFTYRTYLNGVLDTTRTDVAGLSYPVAGDAHYIGLGNYTGIVGFGSGGNVLHGRLDDTRISSLARTDVQILESFRRGALRLDIVRAGGGTGTVTGDLGALDCGAACAEYYGLGTPVVLTATPDPGSTFAGWSGDPDCLDGAVTMAAATTCTANFALATDADQDGYPTPADCDDTDPAIHPGATEICNLLDDNCDGAVDEGVQSTFFADVDDDLFGDAASTTQACFAPSGYVTDNTDCDDNNPNIFPGALEVLDGRDNNCNGLIDEGLNRPPIAVDDAATTAPGTPVTIDVLANDLDPEGEPLAVWNLTPPAHGTAIINKDSTITYTPAAGFRGADSFAYTVYDPHEAEATATVRVTVRAPRPPAPDILANGARGTVAIFPDQRLRVAIALDCGDACGRPAEWWIWARDIRSGATVHYDGADRTWKPGLAPSFRRRLAPLARTTVLDLPHLPPGAYRYRFDVDFGLDGRRSPAASGVVTVRCGNGFFEDFEDGAADRWQDDGAGAWSVHRGRYRLVPRLGRARVHASRYRQRFANFLYRADVRLAEGDATSADRGVGLFFRSDGSYENTYVFHVSASGYYFIFKRVGGRTKYLSGGWIRAAAIRRGTKWNRLQVECVGSRMTFWVNGRLLRRLRDGTFKEGRVGVKAFGGGNGAERFEFDNVSLHVLD